MKPSSQVSDRQLLALMPTLVQAERVSVVDVIEHLVEIDRRRLFLDQACGSLSAYCIERLGYSEDEAGKRVRVTRLGSRLPQVLNELRSGAIHLTGLFLLAHHLTPENYEAVMSEARGQSRRQIEQLIAASRAKQRVDTKQAADAKQRRARGEFEQESWRCGLHAALCKMGFAGTGAPCACEATRSRCLSRHPVAPQSSSRTACTAQFALEGTQVGCKPFRCQSLATQCHLPATIDDRQLDHQVAG